MKKTAILFLLALLMSWKAMSQTRILRCYSYAEKHKDYYGNWTEFSRMKETNFEIVMNFDVGHFSFYSEKTHTYVVLKDEGHEVDEEGDDADRVQDGDQGDELFQRVHRATMGPPTPSANTELTSPG